MLHEAGIDPISVLQQLDRKRNSKRLDHMTFPPYDPAKAAKRLEADPRISRTRASRPAAEMTYGDIREMFAEIGCLVRKMLGGTKGCTAPLRAKVQRTGWSLPKVHTLLAIGPIEPSSGASV